MDSLLCHEIPIISMQLKLLGEIRNSRSPKSRPRLTAKQILQNANTQVIQGYLLYFVGENLDQLVVYYVDTLLEIEDN